MTEVAVSAGEPVAWKLEDDPTFGTRWLEAGGPEERDAVVRGRVRAHRKAGRPVTDYFTSAPVVLPEEPPAELIERLIVAIGPGDEHAVRDAAESAYGEVRAWVAGGGETR